MPALDFAAIIELLIGSGEPQPLTPGTLLAPESLPPGARIAATSATEYHADDAALVGDDCERQATRDAAAHWRRTHASRTTQGQP